MEHDNKIKQKLAFGQIVQSVVKRCLSPAGERLANAMSFSSDIKTVEHEIGLTDEFLSILLSAKAFPCEDFFDMSGELKRLKLKGTFISLEILYNSIEASKRFVRASNFLSMTNKMPIRC